MATQHGDSFEDYFDQMDDREGYSEGRGDLDDFVL